jgi:hypothetical protein
MRKQIIAAAVVLASLLLVAVWNVNFIVEQNKDFLLGRLAGASPWRHRAKIEVSTSRFRSLVTLS